MEISKEAAHLFGRLITRRIRFCIHDRPSEGPVIIGMGARKEARAFCPFLKHGEKCFCVADEVDYYSEESLTYKYSINLGKLIKLSEGKGSWVAEFKDKNGIENHLGLANDDEELSVYGKEFLALLLSCDKIGDITIMFGEKVIAPKWSFDYSYDQGKNEWKCSFYDKKEKRWISKDEFKCGPCDELHLLNNGEKVEKLDRKELEKTCYGKETNTPDDQKWSFDSLIHLAEAKGIEIHYPPRSMYID